MAIVIADAYKALDTGEDQASQPIALETLIAGGETTDVEFKSTLRINLHTGERDSVIEHSTLKTIAGFLNGHGGTLIIGVSDDGAALGIDLDGFKNEDKMYLHLINILRDRIGAPYMMYVHPRFEEYQGNRVLAVECWPSRSPVYLKDGKQERFFVRTGAATTELSMSQTQEFLRQRFAS